MIITFLKQNKQTKQKQKTQNKTKIPSPASYHRWQRCHFLTTWESAVSGSQLGKAAQLPSGL